MNNITNKIRKIQKFYETNDRDIRLEVRFSTDKPPLSYNGDEGLDVEDICKWLLDDEIVIKLYEKVEQEVEL